MDPTSPTRELDSPTVVEFPLRGEWTVERTPGHRIPSHGTDAFGQRYAYDFIRTRGDRAHPRGKLRSFLVGARTADAYGWGQPVHAALHGVVVSAVDGVPERRRLHPLIETWAVVRNTLRFSVGGRPDPAPLAGNHVIVRSTSTYALYAHLAPGSVTVRAGDPVGSGQPLGRVGHTGNSTVPHLHFQLMDRGDPFTAKGMPCVFAAYLERHRDGWRLVERGIPGRFACIRSVPSDVGDDEEAEKSRRGESNP